MEGWKDVDFEVARTRKGNECGSVEKLFRLPFLTSPNTYSLPKGPTAKPILS